jgi:hypothetical protein
MLDLTGKVALVVGLGQRECLYAPVPVAVFAPSMYGKSPGSDWYSPGISRYDERGKYRTRRDSALPARPVVTSVAEHVGSTFCSCPSQSISKIAPSIFSPNPFSITHHPLSLEVHTQVPIHCYHGPRNRNADTNNDIVNGDKNLRRCPCRSEVYRIRPRRK